MPYIGNVPAESYSQVSYQDLTGGSGTSFTLDYPVGSAGEIEVFVNNVRQEPTVAYTVSGTALTMTGSITATDDFYVVFQGKAQQTIGIPEKQANGDYNFDSNTLFIDSSTSSVGIGTSSIYSTAVNRSALSVNGVTDAIISLGNGTTENGFLYANASNTITGTRTATPYIFYTNNTERMRILPTGGITFNGDTAAANALDDYEEGTWSPVFGGDSSDPTVSYAVQNGDYTKVGRIVHVRLHLEISGTASGGSGGLYIGGLPFSSANDGYVAGTVSYKSGWDANRAPTMCLVHPNTTNIPLYLPNSADPRNGSIRSQVGDLGTNTQIYLAVSYNV